MPSKTTRRATIAPGDLADALRLYHDGALSLDALCVLMAQYGARHIAPASPDDAVDDDLPSLARALGLLTPGHPAAAPPTPDAAAPPASDAAAASPAAAVRAAPVPDDDPDSPATRDLTASRRDDRAAAVPDDAPDGPTTRDQTAASRLVGDVSHATRVITSASSAPRVLTPDDDADDDAAPTRVFALGDEGPSRAALDAPATHVAPPALRGGASSALLASTRARLGYGPQALRDFCAHRAIRPRVQLEADDVSPMDLGGDVRYALGDELGQGGVGRVLLAYDRDLRRSVAVKRLHERTLIDPVQVQAFIEEAIITGGLEHPGIVPIYELSYSPQLGPYYAMKRLAGEPLSRVLYRLRRGDPMTTSRFNLFRLLGCFVEVCQAVAYAHDRGVVHCDLKPSNVIVGDYGEVIVVDWGLAKVMGHRGFGQARSRLWSGTPAYMPPEQAHGVLADIDPQSDVWALGAILYELLTWTVPFGAASSDETLRRLASDPIEPPSARAPERHVPPDLERVCMRALSRDKSTRFPSVKALLDDVEAYLEGTREARRREERLALARAAARAALARAAGAEAEVDRLQLAARHLDHPTDDLRAALADARDTLVSTYGDACDALLDGLDVARDPRDPALDALAADLYWRVFERLYPGRVRAGDDHARHRGAAYLERLTSVALAAVVEHGRSRAPAPHDPSPPDDPWLHAVLGLCADRDPDDAAPPDDALGALVQRVAFLKKVPIFARLAGHELLRIAEACEPCSFAAHEPIFAQNDPGDALHAILDGHVDILRDGSCLTTLAPPACFGEVAVLDGSPRTASAVCATPTRTLRLTARRFRRLVAEHGRIGLAVIRVLTARIREATEREARLREENA